MKIDPCSISSSQELGAVPHFIILPQSTNISFSNKKRVTLLSIIVKGGLARLRVGMRNEGKKLPGDEKRLPSVV